jgi:MSHA biogenesis protein MshK
MAARLNTVLLALGLMLPLAAAALQDPTAPPALSADGAAAGQGIPLTAIKQVGPRRVAIIGGQEIAVGGRYEGARVVRITESEVVLRRDGEMTVHKLYPQVDKRPRGK